MNRTLLRAATEWASSPLGRIRSLENLSDVVPGAIGTPFRLGNVVMFHPGRCGSTVVGNMLNQHPSIMWDGEIYHERRSRRRLARHLRLYLWSRMSKAGRRYYGFEVKYLSTHQRDVIGKDWPSYLYLLDRLGINRFILLTRTNRLRYVVSVLVGTARARWHRHPGEDSQLVTVTLDTRRLLTHQGLKPLLDTLQEYDQAERELEDLLARRNTLRLTYEADIAADPTAGYRRICDFLSLPPQDDVSISYVPTSPFPLASIITNLAEVRQALRGTRYEWMLDE